MTRSPREQVNAALANLEMAASVPVPKGHTALMADHHKTAQAAIRECMQVIRTECAGILNDSESP